MTTEPNVLAAAALSETPDDMAATLAWLARMIRQDVERFGDKTDPATRRVHCHELRELAKIAEATAAAWVARAGVSPEAPPTPCPTRGPA